MINLNDEEIELIRSIIKHKLYNREYRLNQNNIQNQMYDILDKLNEYLKS